VPRIQVEVSYVSRAIESLQPLSFNTAEGETPPAMVPRPIIPRASNVIEPTPAQLDLTDFDVVYSRKGPLKVEPSPPPRIGTTTASGAKGKREPLFARLFKSTFRIFTVFERSLMPPKNESFQGIPPWNFQHRVSRTIMERKYTLL